MEIIKESLFILNPSHETLNSGVNFETYMHWMIRIDHLKTWDTSCVSRIT